MDIHEFYRDSGATLADDGIPLHFGDVAAEYDAAMTGAILLDRSHEGRILLNGSDRLGLLQRISTNEVADLAVGESRATIFLNHNGRILDRVIVIQQSAEQTALIAGPGRGPAVASHVQRNVFFQDSVAVEDASRDTVMFSIHGPQADDAVDRLVGDVSAPGLHHGQRAEIGGASVFVVRVTPLVAAHWLLIADRSDAVDVVRAALAAGASKGLRLSGGVVYNVMRIRAGLPAAGRELTSDYIPLELGLWDDVSFSKGCYTGQEIIARMESRNRLARMLVRLETDAPVAQDTVIYVEGKTIGKVTSSVVAPDGQRYAMAVIKSGYANAPQAVQFGQPDGETGRVAEILGARAPFAPQHPA